MKVQTSISLTSRPINNCKLYDGVEKDTDPGNSIAVSHQPWRSVTFRYLLSTRPTHAQIFEGARQNFKGPDVKKQRILTCNPVLRAQEAGGAAKSQERQDSTVVSKGKGL